MTAQCGEKLYYNGELHSMATEPLTYYLKSSKLEFKFTPPNTALWRGYVGTWEIKNDKLYLIDLECFVDKGVRGISYIFNEKKEVFADWFSSQIRLPEGEILMYIHGGYDSIYERDVFLNFKNGILISSEVVENSISEEEFKKWNDLPF